MSWSGFSRKALPSPEIPVPTIAILAHRISYAPLRSPDHRSLNDPDADGARKKTAGMGEMMAYLIAYGVCVLVMGGLDFLWLTNTSKACTRKTWGRCWPRTPTWWWR